MSTPFQLQQQLPQYIGYEGLAQALGVSPSTVRRKVRRSELPGPKEVSPNRRGWRIDELALRYPDKFGQLVANGVSDPKDLPPDELKNQASDLAAQAHAKRTGEAVDRRDIRLHDSPPVSVDDFMAAALADHNVQVAYLAQLPRDQAMMVVAALLPQLRPDLAKTADPAVSAEPKKPGPIDVDFEHILGFLRLFKLKSRLVENGLGMLPGQTVFERFAEFSHGRASVLCAWLFPALLPLFLQNVNSAADREILSDPDRLRELALAVLSDDQWAKIQARILDRQRRGEHPPAPHTPPTAGSDKRWLFCSTEICVRY